MTETVAKPALESLIATYCDAWNEPDPALRERMLRAVWAEQATYTDPTIHASGVRQLVDHISAVQARRPGSRVVRISVVDAHHGLFRFAWRRTLADGTSLPDGIDFGEVSGDGKLQLIVGFFGPLAVD